MNPLLIQRINDVANIKLELIEIDPGYGSVYRVSIGHDCYVFATKIASEPYFVLDVSYDKDIAGKAMPEVKCEYLANHDESEFEKAAQWVKHQVAILRIIKPWNQ